MPFFSIKKRSGKKKLCFSSQNHQNFVFFGLVPKSPIHTGLICVRTPEPKISSLSPLILEIDEMYTYNHLNTTKGMAVNSLEYKSVSKSAL
jgi:hypothetical protein